MPLDKAPRRTPTPLLDFCFALLRLLATVQYYLATLFAALRPPCVHGTPPSHLVEVCVVLPDAFPSPRALKRLATLVAHLRALGATRVRLHDGTSHHTWRYRLLEHWRLSPASNHHQQGGHEQQPLDHHPDGTDHLQDEPRTTRAGRVDKAADIPADLEVVLRPTVDDMDRWCALRYEDDDQDDRDRHDCREGSREPPPSSSSLSTQSTRTPRSPPSMTPSPPSSFTVCLATEASGRAALVSAAQQFRARRGRRGGRRSTEGAELRDPSTEADLILIVGPTLNLRGLGPLVSGRAELHGVSPLERLRALEAEQVVRTYFTSRQRGGT